MSNLRIYSPNMVTKYVLFLVARVGSTYLSTLLNSHPEILALGEELRDLEKEGAEAQLNWSLKFLTPPLISRHRARGFNVKLVHLADPTGFANLLREKESKAIILQRRNRVKAVISRINGSRLYKRTGMWGLFDDTNRLEPFEVDLEQFDEYLQHREKVDLELEKYVADLGIPMLSVYYEDLLKDETVFLQEIYSFLNVGFAPVEGSTLKITSDNLKEVILNFDDLRSKYAGTVYEPMFDEVITP